jgi:hypothetical protein
MSKYYLPLVASRFDRVRYCFLSFLFLSFCTGASGQVREIRIFDGAGLFRAQGVSAQPANVKSTTSTPNVSKSSSTETKERADATVEVLLDKLPSSEELRLSPLDSIGDPLNPQIVGEQNGKLLFHFQGVRSGSWEINVPTEQLLEVRILDVK